MDFDLVVIGAGPGGYVAAIKAAQLGKKVALVEAKDLGGTCLNVGCIPTKALLSNAELLHRIQHAEEYGIQVGQVSFDYSGMIDRKDRVIGTLRQGVEGLVKANKITLFRGHGRFTSDHEVKVLGDDNALLRFESAIIATGSDPLNIPAFPFDFDRVHSSTSILDVKQLPNKLAIVGGGYIGCEAAALYRSMGVEVVILEMLPSIVTTEGKDIAATLTKAFETQGIELRCGVMVESIERGEGVKVLLKDNEPVTADMALVAVGRKFNGDDVGLDKAGVVLHDKGFIPVDDKMRTNLPHIYAIGDVTGKMLLAHVASHQGVVAAINAAGGDVAMHYNAVPSVIFTHPELARVGLLPEEAPDAQVGRFPFQALGRSIATMETEGFAQIVSDKSTGEILGAQVVGVGASSLIAEMALAIANELTLESVADTIHAHPTTPEAWHEASLMAMGTPLHLPPRRK